jgi:hypothetical protein
MAKITAVIPEPTPEYTEDNQRQLRESLDTMKNELNFGYQEDLKQELQRFTWFNMRFGC